MSKILLQDSCNDNRILETAVALAKRRPHTNVDRVEGDTLIQERDVVLLTHDRILQLKAMHHHVLVVPIAEMPKFSKWMLADTAAIS